MSRANGGLGMVGVTAEKRKEVQEAFKRSRKVEQRETRKYEWGVNKQNNSQKHFRVSSYRMSFNLTMLIIPGSFATMISECIFASYQSFGGA